MEVFAGLSVCILILVSLLVATRTIAVWRRSKGLPELLLSLMLVSATVLGYPLTIASSQIPPSQMWPLHVASQLFISFGFACLLLFTLKVFRADTRWATCLAAVTLLVLVVGTTAYALELAGENPRSPGDMLEVSLLISTAIAVTYFWTTFESLRYYQQLRLRLRLGLTQIGVANRVLLWGLMSLAAGIAVLVNAGGILVGAFLSPPIVVVSSILGLVHAGCLLLAFHPPAWYSSWLERRAVAAPSSA